MRRSIGPVVCLACALPWLDPAAPAQDFDKVEIQTVRVADGVWMLTGAGGNIAVSAGEDGVLLIDDEFPQLVEKIKAALPGYTLQPLELGLKRTITWFYETNAFSVC